MIIEVSCIYVIFSALVNTECIFKYSKSFTTCEQLPFYHLGNVSRIYTTKLNNCLHQHGEAKKKTHQTKFRKFNFKEDTFRI